MFEDMIHYIDVNPPVLKAEPKPDFIIVDFRDIFEVYGKKTEQYELYKRFPLQEIIQKLLFFNVYTLDDDFIYNELEIRYHDEMHLLDYDAVTEYAIDLQCALDTHIRSLLHPSIDSGLFVYSRWIGPTTMILQKHV